MRRVSAGLAALNARHPWSHNDHFHGWILRHLPSARGAALDIGCGTGGLAIALADRFEQVTAIDADAAMVRAARLATAALPNVAVRQSGPEDVEGRFDLVTMIAVLHHLPLRPALLRLRELVAPGGRVLVVGLAPPASVSDTVWDLSCAVTNPLIGLVKHPRVARTPLDRAPFPVAEPSATIAEIRSATREVLPGSRLRRREGFRFTLAWTAP
ncbi:class I SAM-dependent methyltransferase [Calidifontibacter sp. DB0510]|uniref:Class I SAM-dependent methyltransferase n=1 Tax=Metallococcus carri TaxID=1656884 RepID=A0A967EEY0_9MICO|nr:class I SAM-dependent methyltransferase [Metallococcus carri]NOP37442.1 class I SAM-dependent methyltransferase [Calidifontibacter sp. DB2511S]